MVIYIYNVDKFIECRVTKLLTGKRKLIRCFKVTKRQYQYIYVQNKYNLCYTLYFLISLLILCHWDPIANMSIQGYLYFVFKKLISYYNFQFPNILSTIPSCINIV